MPDISPALIALGASISLAQKDSPLLHLLAQQAMEQLPQIIAAISPGKDFSKFTPAEKSQYQAELQKLKIAIGELSRQLGTQRTGAEQQTLLLGETAQKLGLDMRVINELANGTLQVWADQFREGVGSANSSIHRTADKIICVLERLPAMGADASELVASALGIETLPTAQALENTLTQQLTGLPPPLVQNLLQGQLSNEESAAILQEVTQFAETQVIGLIAQHVPQAQTVVELVAAVQNLPPMSSAFSDIQTSTESLQSAMAVAATAAQLLGNKGLANDLAKASSYVQTGMQMYQAAGVLYAASGWGAVLAASSMLSGVGGFASFGSSLTGGGNDNTQVLQAIAALKV